MFEKEVYWSRFANDFEERNDYVVGQTDLRIVLEKISELNGLKKTLELGCGNGTYSKALYNGVTELLATDFSDEMVESSKTRLTGFPKIRVEKANCFDLPYQDNLFDTVFMANLLHIIPEPEKALEEINRVIKPGGTMIVLSYTTDGMKFPHILGMIYRYLRKYGKPSPHARKLSLSNACGMLLKQGLEIKSSELIGIKSKALFVMATKPLA